MQIRWHRKQALAVEARTDGEIIISQEVSTTGARRFGCVCEEAFGRLRGITLGRRMAGQNETHAPVLRPRTPEAD